MTESLNVIEIYPKIFVYKGLFKDIDKTYSFLKKSKGEEDGLFSPWSQWSHFGEYLSPTFSNHPGRLSIDYIEKIKTRTDKQELQRLAILELFKNFYLVTEDYALRNGVDLDKTKTVLSNDGEIKEEWQINGPSIVRYRTDISDPLAMTYHSDYIREPIISPGYKFAITALAYFNDDYEGGEIRFPRLDGYTHKPKAGDILLCPSNYIYEHASLPMESGTKYCVVVMTDINELSH